MKKPGPESPSVGDAAQHAAELTALATELRDTQAQLLAVRDALKQAEQAALSSRKREAQLERELQHRVRNMLAVIRSVFSRTVESRTSLTDASDHFQGRLDVLARYHTSSPLHPDYRHDIEDMVREELLYAGSGDDPRITVTGPEAHLGGRAAESFGLALHELVTNSIKFGVLSPGSSRGELLAKWRCVSGHLRFEWIESGVSIVASAPLRRGFGREFIEDSLPYQIDAKTSVDIAPGRIAWLIDLPPDR